MGDLSVHEAIFTTRSMRHLKPDPVSRADLEYIIEAATMAPSAGNTQMWSFVVVTDPEQIAKIGAAYRDVGERYIGDGVLADPNITADRRRVYSKAMHNVEHLDQSPAIIVPCLHGRAPGQLRRLVGLLQLDVSGSAEHPAGGSLARPRHGPADAGDGLLAGEAGGDGRGPRRARSTRRRHDHGAHPGGLPEGSVGPSLAEAVAGESRTGTGGAVRVLVDRHRDLGVPWNGVAVDVDPLHLRQCLALLLPELPEQLVRIQSFIGGAAPALRGDAGRQPPQLHQHT